MARFEPRPDRMAGRFVRPLLLAAGAVLVGIGAIGVFVPLLPTTIFLILAAACFGRSSPGAYRWLTTNRAFGPMLRDYNEGRGATLRAKVTSIMALWLGLALAAWLVGNPWVGLALAGIGLAVTVHLLRLRTVRRPAA
ncbi:MAG: YbaN family protein [Dehalococcoidia bacterium]